MPTMVKAELNDGRKIEVIRVPGFGGSPWKDILPALAANLNCHEDDLDTHEVYDAEENLIEVITLNGVVVGKFI